jgi:hypothetical protein
MFRRLMLLATLGAAAAGVFSMAWGASQWRPAVALTNCDTSTAGVDAAEQQVVAEINAFRAENGVAPLKVSPNLSRAAAWMTEDLLANGYWSHTDSWGRSAFTRVQQCGYASSGAGENLAKGFGAATVVEAWKASKDGHRENMLNSWWTVIGVGNAGGYWAADFGVYDDSGEGGAPSGPATQTPFPPTSTPTTRFSTPTQPAATPTQFVPAPNDSYSYPSFVPIRRASIPMIAAE